MEHDVFEILPTAGYEDLPHIQPLLEYLEKEVDSLPSHLSATSFSLELMMWTNKQEVEKVIQEVGLNGQLVTIVKEKKDADGDICCLVSFYVDRY